MSYPITTIGALGYAASPVPPPPSPNRDLGFVQQALMIDYPFDPNSVDPMARLVNVGYAQGAEDVTPRALALGVVLGVVGCFVVRKLRRK